MNTIRRPPRTSIQNAPFKTKFNSSPNEQTTISLSKQVQPKHPFLTKAEREQQEQRGRITPPLPLRALRMKCTSLPTTADPFASFLNPHPHDQERRTPVVESLSRFVILVQWLSTIQMAHRDGVHLVYWLTTLVYWLTSVIVVIYLSSLTFAFR